jgi:hypothetical protein
LGSVSANLLRVFVIFEPVETTTISKSADVSILWKALFFQLEETFGVRPGVSAVSFILAQKGRSVVDFTVCFHSVVLVNEGLAQRF